MSLRKVATMAAWGAFGFAAVLVVAGYFAAVTSIAAPVDWVSVLSLALWFAPIGAVVGVCVAAERLAR